VVGVAYAVSFTTALQRVYLRSWRRPPGGGLRNRGRGLLWLTTVLGLLTFLSLLRSVAGEVGSWGPRATGQHGAVVVDRAHPVAR